MEILDAESSRAHKRASLMKAIMAALLAGAMVFVVLFLLIQLQPGTSGLIGAGVAVVVAGVVAAIATPTPHRER